MSDLISREAAIEIIQSMYPGMPRVPWMREDWQKRYEPYIRTENAIRELPSAQRWIPVSERLPEEDKNVIVPVHFDVPGQRKDAGWYVDIASQIDGNWVSYSDEYKIAKDYHKVVAWMPLPEPWKGEKDG